jgi:hypothetical protein
MLVAAAALAAACCTLVGVYEGASNWTIVMVRCLTQSLTSPSVVQQQAGDLWRTHCAPRVTRFVSAMTACDSCCSPQHNHHTTAIRITRRSIRAYGTKETTQRPTGSSTSARSVVCSNVASMLARSASLHQRLIALRRMASASTAHPTYNGPS